MLPGSVRFKFILFFSLAISTFGAGCVQPGASLPDLKGNYQGVESLRGFEYPVIANLPDYQHVNDQSVLTFKSFRILASSQGSDIHIAFNPNNSSVSVSASNLAIDSMNLKVTNSCADGSQGKYTARLCWASGDLRLVVYSDNITKPDLKLKLLRGSSQFETSTSFDSSGNISVDELLGRAKFLSYTVSSEAERVFQARENIKVARGNLLPKLSIRAVVGAFTGDYLSVVSSALPFIFPNNWYRLDEANSLFQAERNSFASLRGNEMNFVETLAYLIYRDQAFAGYLNSQIAWMLDTQKGLAVEETVGIVPQGTADALGLTIGALKNDRLALGNLITNEFIELSQSVSLSPINGVQGLLPLDPPALDSEPELKASDFVDLAKTNSFEVVTLSQLFAAAKTQTSEITYGFLDPESNGSLGFGTNSSIAIGQSHEAEIQIKISEMNSLIEERAAQVATDYDGAIESYQLASRNFAATEKKLNLLMQRHLNADSTLDENTYVGQLTDLQLKMIEFKSDQLSNSFAWMMARAKHQRLLLQGAYVNLDSALPGKLEKLPDPNQPSTLN